MLKLVEIDLSLIWIGAEPLLTLSSSDLKSESLLGDARVLVSAGPVCIKFPGPSRLVGGGVEGNTPRKISRRGFHTDF